jgi:hypothetical protein
MLAVRFCWKAKFCPLLPEWFVLMLCLPKIILQLSLMLLPSAFAARLGEISIQLLWRSLLHLLCLI